MTDALIYLALTYLVAAIPFGVVVTTFQEHDLDVRAAGSGSIGAANVARLFGWKVAARVLLLDLLKGLVPVLGAYLLWPEGGRAFASVVALVAFVGHCWPVYLEFRGGKGVTTAAGAMLGISPIATALSGAAWLVLLAFTGRASIASLGATLAAFGFAAWFDPAALLLVALLAIGIAVRHASNIVRVAQGDEEEFVRPVRWGRRSAGPASAEEVLQQDPAGGARPSVAWKEGPTQADS